MLWQGKYEMRPASSDDVLNLPVEMPAYWHLAHCRKAFYMFMVSYAQEGIDIKFPHLGT